MRFLKWLGHWAVLPARYLFVAAISLLACVSPVSAQESEELTPPKVEGKVIVGGANFGEEIPHGVVGGAFRVYVTKRFFISPEVRVGREPNLRGTVNLGHVFAGRK